MREKLIIHKATQGLVWETSDSSIVGGTKRPPHTHDELELNLVTAGQGRYLISGSSYDLVPGTLIWLFPGQPHVLTHHTADFEMIVGVFRPSLVGQACRSGTSICLRTKRSERVLSRILTPSAMERLQTLCKDVIRAHDDPTWFNAGITFMLRQSWAAYEASRDEPGGKALHPAINRAAHLLSAETDPLSLPVLARQCGLSYSRLCRVFNTQMGMSLLEFRDRRRLEQFRRLYGSGQTRTMLDCALDSGFGSYAQFHRVFKKYLTTSPRDYHRTFGITETKRPLAS